ncbi:hypothetical protein BWZ22_14755 [Seonamhaeicola sp. S2-3]|uniref:hypothetical protein n=1 Tax=Seonamhaeicola sp. S2-3 TaxID=1936081 RepID=UPI000972D35E|nr:hypothetical protein [Seonamhaeicola sp. S2-3]APY12405.1 hypothetical protein BWZ22_14755 [Seonamhaeicola sp. S2-3]
MNKFIKNIILFSITCLILLTLFLKFYGSYIDYFYEKFTTPKATSLIIGGSRSLQGIQPKIIDDYFNNNEFQLPMFNFSFTIAQSRIGPLYRKSILKKLNNKSKNGLFIISITPWMLSSHKANDNNAGEFKEADAPPNNMNYMSMDPNFEYLIKNLDYFHFRGIFRKSSKLHENGWLEENNLPKDSLVFRNWKKNQVNILKGFVKDYSVSEYRKQSLDTLIKDLKKHGSVYLVRTPVDKDILELENNYYPEFDNFIKKTAQDNNINYLNYNELKSKKFKTYDGHHLDKYGGEKFTNLLCDSISKLNKI